MATNLKYSAVLKNAMESAINATLGANATLKIYSGTQPDTPDTPVTSQTLLATLTCAATFGTTSGGVLTIGSITNGIGTASAGTGTTATWFRFSTSGGTAHIDGTVGISACDLNLDNPNIATGQTVSISSWTLANGN